MLNYVKIGSVVLEKKTFKNATLLFLTVVF